MSSLQAYRSEDTDDIYVWESKPYCKGRENWYITTAVPLYHSKQTFAQCHFGLPVNFEHRCSTYTLMYAVNTRA